MTLKQLIALLAASTMTFLCILFAGGYIYLVNPASLGIPSHGQTPSASATRPLAIWEIELEQRRSEIQQLHKALQRMQDSISRMHAQVALFRQKHQDAQRELLTRQQQLESLQNIIQRDSVRLKNLRTLAEMYDKAEPAEVAKILASTDNSNAALLLTMMKRKVAARVIEHLPKDKAATIVQSVLKMQ